MAKLTDLTFLTNIEGNDEFYVVDVSDTSESAQGTSKKITRDQFSLGVNHTSLASLLIDVHTQYPLLAGRGTGQTLNGGSQASGTLTLDSTSNATKGNIILNPTGGDVGIGTTSPQGKFDVSWGGTSNNDFSLILGADIGSFSTRTNNTDKYAALALPHYTNSEENVVGFVMYSGATNTSINYGGSSGNGNAANVLGFWTAPTNTTTGGTERMRIDRNGAVGFKVIPADWNTTYSPIQAGRTVLFDTGTGGYYGWNFYNNASGTNRYIGSGEQGAVGFEGGSFDVYSGLSQASGSVTGVALVLSLKKDRTLALQGALQTSGIGISFPSTQNASTNANTLDDYEEGTFTPTLASGFSTAPTSYTTQNGTYTKIGRLVYFQIVLIPNGAVANATHLIIGGLPFLSVNSSTDRYGLAVVTYQTGFNTNAGDSYLVTANVTTVTLYDNAGNERLGNSAGVNINTAICLSGFYHTAT